MNERIKGLAIKAGLYHLLPNGTAYPRAMSAEQCENAYNVFSQLLIQDCIELIQNVPNGYKDYRNQIENEDREACIWSIQNTYGIPVKAE